MKTELLSGRTFYQSSGRVNWGRFLPLALLVFLASGLGAELLNVLFRAGHYYVIVVPAVAGVGIAALVHLAVAKGQCRSTWVAGLMGFAAGVLLYFGYYYLAMVNDLGPLAQPRLLPAYIRLRMATDVTRDLHEPDKEEQPRRHSGDSLSNWAHFWIETVVVLCFTTAGGLRRARKTYCESCGRWMTRELTYFDPVKEPELLEALRHGSARSLSALCAAPVFSTVPNTTLALECCPSLKDGTAHDCRLYASIKNITANPAGAKLDPFETAKGKLLVRYAELNRDELPALALRFPFLETITGRSAVAALAPLPDELESQPAGGVFAEITSPGSDHAGKVLTRKTILIGNGLVLLALVGIFASVGLMAWGALTAFPDHPTGPIDPATKLFGLGLLGLGGALFLVVAVVSLMNPSFLGSRYLLKRVKAEFARRPGVLVPPDDPEALFVEIVPKLNWGKLSLETASDVGLLRLDRSRREILFEGDKQRWRIPVAALTYCEVEFFVEGKGTHAARKIYYTVLRAAHPNQFWEAPIRERAGTGLFQSGRRKKSAEKLCCAIREMQRTRQPAAVS